MPRAAVLPFILLALAGCHAQKTPVTATSIVGIWEEREEASNIKVVHVYEFRKDGTYWTGVNVVLKDGATITPTGYAPAPGLAGETGKKDMFAKEGYRGKYRVEAGKLWMTNEGFDVEMAGYAGSTPAKTPEFQLKHFHMEGDILYFDQERINGHRQKDSGIYHRVPSIRLD